MEKFISYLFVEPKVHEVNDDDSKDGEDWDDNDGDEYSPDSFYPMWEDDSGNGQAK